MSVGTEGETCNVQRSVIGMISRHHVVMPKVKSGNRGFCGDDNQLSTRDGNGCLLCGING